MLTRIGNSNQNTSHMHGDAGGSFQCRYRHELASCHRILIKRSVLLRGCPLASTVGLSRTKHIDYICDCGPSCHMSPFVIAGYQGQGKLLTPPLWHTSMFCPIFVTCSAVKWPACSTCQRLLSAQLWVVSSEQKPSLQSIVLTHLLSLSQLYLKKCRA